VSPGLNRAGSATRCHACDIYLISSVAESVIVHNYPSLSVCRRRAATPRRRFGGGFTLGLGTRPSRSSLGPKFSRPQILARPPNVAVLLTHCGQLILRKELANLTSDFKAKMHKIRFPLGLRPTPCWGAYSAPPYPLAVLRGLLLRGRWGERDERGRGGKGTAPTMICCKAYKPFVQLLCSMQLTRFRLTERIARSLRGSRDSSVRRQSALRSMSLVRRSIASYTPRQHRPLT